MSDFLFRGSLADLDPDVYELTQVEAERQCRKLILIPSESRAPMVIMQAQIDEVLYRLADTVAEVSKTL